MYSTPVWFYLISVGIRGYLLKMVVSEQFEEGSQSPMTAWPNSSQPVSHNHWIEKLQQRLIKTTVLTWDATVVGYLHKSINDVSHAQLRLLLMLAFVTFVLLFDVVIICSSIKKKNTDVQKTLVAAPSKIAFLWAFGAKLVNHRTLNLNHWCLYLWTANSIIELATA